jgi:nicotinate phosphoribosyltransferase
MYSPESLLDTDLYKLTMQQAVLELFPNEMVTYQFNNRRPTDVFSDIEVAKIRYAVEEMANLKLKSDEFRFLKTLPFLKPWYLAYLKDYRFDPSEVVIMHENGSGNLKINIAGPWHSTILWEVPLMAIISEVYFSSRTPWNKDDFRVLSMNKISNLHAGGCKFAEFGTRRRRSYDMQNAFIEASTYFTEHSMIGTSNVHFAHKFNLKPIGTTAHEWTMAHSALCGLEHANKYALENWTKVYQGQLGIALTDTFGTDAFFKDFNLLNAKIYDGVRQDSGDPIIFRDKMIKHYKNLGINPLHKTIVFSDGLDVKEANNINDHCFGKIGCSFGIGTHLTNDVPDSKALNIVIKLRAVNGQEVVKISDTPGKATGDAQALEIAMKVFNVQKS